MALLARAMLIGIGATLVMDAWGLLQKHVFKIPPLDYRLLGRWIGHLPRGQFVHASINRAPAVRGELAIGWSAHYLIGITFAGLLLVIAGAEWAQRPTLLPALFVGWGTVLAPFLVLQPGMGAGFAASKTPRPWFARLRSLVTHTVYGAGLFLAGVFWARVLPSWW